MTRLVGAAIGAILLAASASAQAPADSVEIGGWTLPEGTVVTTTSNMTYKATMSVGGDEAPYRLATRDSLTTRIDRLRDGRLHRAVQQTALDETTVQMAGRDLPPQSSPLLGRWVTVERTEDGWTRSAPGWTPNREQRDALAAPVSLDDDEYPLRMAVGQTVRVSQDAIGRVYAGASDALHRLTVRLDSVGTVGGAPVAYLTQDVDVTVEDDEIVTRMQMRARIVRRLDWRLDVETHWTGRMTTTLDEDFVIDGYADHRMEQSAAPPEFGR